MVSTRPIKRLRVTQDDSGLLLDPREAARELAALPPAEYGDPDNASPYLTVYLDWQTIGSDPSRRPGRRQFESDAKQVLAEYAPRSAAADSLSVDIARIGRYLNGERIERNVEHSTLPASAQGIVIVARAADGVFTALPLGVPVETRVIAEPIPALAELVRVGEDYEPYAVLLADQQEATLTFIAQRRSQRTISAQGANYPFKRNAGGNQRRYRARAGERLDQFARSVAAGVRQELDTWGAHVLIVAGDEVITSALKQFFADSVLDCVVGMMRNGITASPQDLIAKSWPIAQQAEREREQAVVERIAQTIASGGPAVSGSIAVLKELQSRRVRELALLDDFSEMGWADYTARLVGAGEPPREHPTGGSRSSVVPVRLGDELVRRAVLSDAEIEIVQSGASGEMSQSAPDAGRRTEMARQLDDFGGVAAMLRY